AGARGRVAIGLRLAAQCEAVEQHAGRELVADAAGLELAVDTPLRRVAAPLFAEAAEVVEVEAAVGAVAVGVVVAAARVPAAIGVGQVVVGVERLPAELRLPVPVRVDGLRVAQAAAEVAEV